MFHMLMQSLDKTFEIEYDASGWGIGAHLMSDWKPLMYFSEKLNRAALNYSTYDKELLALVCTLMCDNTTYGLENLWSTLIMKTSSILRVKAN